MQLADALARYLSELWPLHGPDNSRDGIVSEGRSGWPDVAWWPSDWRDCRNEATVELRPAVRLGPRSDWGRAGRATLRLGPLISSLAIVLSFDMFATPKI